MFSVNSICPSQSATQYKDAIKILVNMNGKEVDYGRQRE